MTNLAEAFAIRLSIDALKEAKVYTHGNARYCVDHVIENLQSSLRTVEQFPPHWPGYFNNQDEYENGWRDNGCPMLVGGKRDYSHMSHCSQP